MDHYLSLIAAAIFFFLLFQAWSGFFTSRQLKLPPSPPSLPIIGHLHLLARGGLPHHFFSRLADRWGPLVHLQLGVKSLIVASDLATATEILKVKDVMFAFRPSTALYKHVAYNHKDMATAPYDKPFIEMKKVFKALLLSAESLKHFDSVRSQELSWLISELWKASSTQKKPFQLREYLAAMIYNVFTRITLGKRYYYGVHKQESIDDGLKAGAMTLRFAMEGCIADFFPWLEPIDRKPKQIKKVHQAMDQFLQAIVDEHKASSQNDLLSKILEVMGQDEQRIKGLLYNILTGGTDSTSTVVEWALAHLVRNKPVLSKVQREIDGVIAPGQRVEPSDIDKLPYLKAVVKESLRLTPPVPLLGHCTSQACTVAGYDVQAGTWAFINVYAISRDTRLWEDPLEFKPERFIDGLNKHVNVYGQDLELLPFGSGRRVCPGALLAMINVHVTMATLLHCFNWEVEKEVDMKEARGINNVMLHPLEVLPTPRVDVAAVYGAM